jgi:HEPN domain-containing protein
MSRDEKVKYWIDLAEYDLKKKTARAMLKTKRYLYVAFICHQVIEKMLK